MSATKTNNKRLANRVALVTGGASGLGKAMSQRFASDGATVVITDINAELGQTVAAENGFTFLQHDVTDEAQWSAVIAEVEKRFGRLDIVINNAGIVGPMNDISP